MSVPESIAHVLITIVFLGFDAESKCTAYYGRYLRINISPTLVPVDFDAMVGWEQPLPILLEGPARELIESLTDSQARLVDGRVERVLTRRVGAIVAVADETANLRRREGH